MQSYNHFTLNERFCIAENLKKGKSIRSIAYILERSPSSVSREINRNKDSNGNYDCIKAEENYKNNRKRSKKKLKLLKDKTLFDFVYEKLKQFWSPEMISIIARKQNLIISVKAIYQAIKNGLFPGITSASHLRRRGKKYCYGGRNRYNTIQPEHTIHERPVSADNRSCLGHWEGDTILGGLGKGCLVILIDRKSRISVALKSNSKSKKDVGDALINALLSMKIPIPILSITLDNGSEFADFKRIERELGTTVYFADPHSPWQRGSSENINDSYRFFFKKGKDFRNITDEQVQEAVDLINNRPRKCLGNLTPVEYLKKVLHLD